MPNLLDGWFKIDIGEAAFYAVFGLLFVVVGITLLVLIFTLLGMVMKKAGARKSKPKPKKGAEKAEATPVAEQADKEGVTPELIAVITAAIAAQMESENTPCEFVVRRIRKL